MNTKVITNIHNIFYLFLLLLFGIVVAKELYIGNVETLLIVLIILSALVLYLGYKRKFINLFLLLAVFFLGNGLYFIAEANYSVKEYSGTVSVVGRVSDSFEETDYSYVVVLDNVSINGEKAKNILATFSKGSQVLEIGSFLAFESEVDAIPLFTFGNLTASTYRAGLGYSLSASTSDIVITDGFVYFDETVRQTIKTQIYNNMSAENAAVAYAVLFGDDSGISFAVYQSYRNSGIIHIITVSGLNVAFLITLIYGFLKLCKCNKFLNIAITIIVILLYTYICNFAPSVFRAAVMGVVIMLRRLCRKRYDVLNSAGIAGFIILIFSPLTAFDTGFLMSIACVCGIVLLNPLFYKAFKKCMPRWVAMYISVSLSAQLAILPFLASFQSSVNLLSFVINLFVVPLFAVLYPFLFVISFLSLILPFLSVFFTLVDWGLTATELIPLRNFRNWLVSIRQNPEYRDNKRRNGSVYEKSNGDLGLGPFKLSARRIILEKLLKLEVETGFNLISIEELKTIDKMWDYEGDLSRRMLVDTYYKVKKVKLPWDDYKTPLYDEKTIKQIKNASEKNNIPFELIAKLLLSIDKYKFYTRGNKVQKDFDKILNQGWLHIENIKEGLKNED